MPENAKLFFRLDGIGSTRPRATSPVPGQTSAAVTSTVTNITPTENAHHPLEEPIAPGEDESQG
jgi:hypothetical protein